jgi:hypothetical protein
MTPHDYLIILINAIGWLAVLWRNKKKDVIRNWEHDRMWNDYALEHEINGHGKPPRRKGD